MAIASQGFAETDATRALRIIESMPGYAWSADAAGRFTFVSASTLAFLGETHEDPNLSDAEDEFGWRRVVHPEDYERVAAKWRHCLQTGDHYDTEHRLRCADGVYRWIRNSGRPLRDGQGRITEWCGTTIDIEEQKQAEAALRERERELSQLVDIVPSHLWRLTPDGEPIFFNKRMVDFLGLDIADTDKPGTSRLETVMETVHPDDAAEFRDTLNRCLATGESFVMRYRLRRADGVYRWMSSRSEPMRDERGCIVQWYGVSIDVDDEVRARQAEESLRQASAKLAQATQAASLAELSASIAHEVNQPLAAIVASSHACQRWLKNDPPNLERAQIIVERIIRDANSAADVVARIRALFRQDVGPRNYAAFHSVIDDTRSIMAEEAARRQVHMEIEVEGNLPLAAFDRVQVQQVLINLIRNGMEAMDSAAGDRILAMRVRRMGEMVQTEISDRGPGIEQPDKIFEPFFTTKEDGMGMGLAICRSIVESHGGRLWAEENKPHGAMFIFTLPIEEKATQ